MVNAPPEYRVKLEQNAETAGGSVCIIDRGAASRLRPHAYLQLIEYVHHSVQPSVVLTPGYR